MATENIQCPRCGTIQQATTDGIRIPCNVCGYTITGGTWEKTDGITDDDEYVGYYNGRW